MRGKLRFFIQTVAVMLCLLVCLLSKSPIYASGVCLDDGAGLFSDKEEYQSITRALQQVREENKIDIVIVTVNGTGSKSPKRFADDYLDEGGYGFGAENNGILLLIDMAGREIYISTKGTTALESFSDRRIDEMLDDVADALKDEDYVQSARVFIRGVDRYMGTDPDERVREPLTVPGILFRLGIAVIAGLASSVILWLILRRGTPVAVSAGDYLLEDTVRITGQEDRFINTVTTTRHIERSSSSGSQTTTHTSSSGQTHGGGGRSF